ncbi:MAG: hypothetical protein GXO14_02900 [Thermococci archaeon]|nr:hypothetical protein [Thermococci archaeon]
MDGVPDSDDPPGGWLSRLLNRGRRAVLEQELSDEAYRAYRKLLMRARPDVKNGVVIVNLPEGRVELRPGRLIVKAPTKKSAEKILRNIHHYGQPPSLWPAYGLSYSLKDSRGRGPKIL